MGRSGVLHCFLSAGQTLAQLRQLIMQLALHLVDLSNLNSEVPCCPQLHFLLCLFSGAEAAPPASPYLDRFVARAGRWQI